MSTAHGAVQVSLTKEQLARMAADLFATVAAEAIAARGSAQIALTGGSTPRALYTMLTTPEYLAGIDWPKVHLWFGDERCVPPDHPDSNYRMVRESLLGTVPIPPAQVHRMEGEAQPPEEGAEHYSRELNKVFGLTPGQWPRFDLVLLGMGPDGHTASLFPNTAALAITDRLCVANTVPQLHTTRLTLTFPVLNAAARVVFLIAGEEKAPMIHQVLEETADPLLPAQRINPESGQLLWLLDVDAAGQLQA